MMIVLLDSRNARTSASVISISPRRDMKGSSSRSIRVLDAHLARHAARLAREHPTFCEQLRRETVVRVHLDLAARELRHAARAVAFLARERRIETRAARRMQHALAGLVGNLVLLAVEHDRDLRGY